jgi:hypothetical protein
MGNQEKECVEFLSTWFALVSQIAHGFDKLNLFP